MLRIFHTADVHVGLRFVRNSLDSLRDRLVEERIHVVGRMVELAMQEKADLFVVAGDLFDSVRVSKAAVRKVAEQLKRFDGLVVVLPGNHDFVQDPSEDSLWPDFVRHLGDRHLFLNECRAYDLRPLGFRAIVYAGPCTSRHSPTNAIGWIDSLDKRTRNEGSDCFHIGIAHGSLEGLSPDFSGDYFPMTRSQLERTQLDLWLLGHTHVRFPAEECGQTENILYPSVPEPDGFDCGHSGYAWLIELASDQGATYRSLPTGRYRFHDLIVDLQSEADIQEFENSIVKLDRQRDLVKVLFTGRLESDLRKDLVNRLDRLRNHVLHLEFDTSGVMQRIQQTDIDSEFTEGSFPHKLLSQLAVDNQDQLALQLAYELMGQSKS
jgi:DNA repair protein SbcD/Mre11